MRMRMFFAVVTGVAFFLAVSTQDLRAATAADPAYGDKLHVVAKAELHDAIVASSAEAAAARQSVKDFLARSQVQSQIERMGFEPAAISSRVALLNDSEILRLQSQVMAADQQSRPAGLPAWGWIAIGIGIAIGIVGLVIGYQMVND